MVCDRSRLRNSDSQYFTPLDYNKKTRKYASAFVTTSFPASVMLGHGVRRIHPPISSEVHKCSSSYNMTVVPVIYPIDR